MKYIVAVIALLFPALAFAQVLPLEDVMQTRIFSARFNGPIHHLTKAMLPSKLGHAGYEPKHIVVGPGAGTGTANASDTNMKYYIDIQHESGFDTITYEGDKAKQFFTLLTDGELKDEIAFIVIIDPADADYVGDVIYVAGYLKDGTYFGQMTISRDRVAAAVDGMKAPATAEKPAA